MSNEKFGPKAGRVYSDIGVEQCVKGQTTPHSPDAIAYMETILKEGAKSKTNRREAKEIDSKMACLERMQEDARSEHDNLRIQTDLAIAAITPSLTGAIGVLSAQINRWMRHQGFWSSRNVGEKLALMHSEISEAMEADRKSLPSEHIEGYTGVEEEMADVVIRVLDFCHENDLRLVEALQAKMAFNLSRPHMHGKKY